MPREDEKGEAERGGGLAWALRIRSPAASVLTARAKLRAACCLAALLEPGCAAFTSAVRPRSGHLRMEALGMARARSSCGEGFKAQLVSGE